MRMAPSFGALKRALTAALVAGAAAAQAGQLSANVAVTVRFLSSSGACGALGQGTQVNVACTPAGGVLLPQPGAFAYQRVGTIHSPGFVAQPLPVFSDGVRIASWRVVHLDSAEYLELTVAW